MTKVNLTLTREHKAIANAAAEDEGRYLFNTVLFKDGYLYATDGAALVRRPVEHIDGKGKEFLIPRKFLQSLAIPKGREAVATQDSEEGNYGSLEVHQPNGTTTGVELEDHHSYPDVLQHVKEQNGPPTFSLKARNLLRVLQALGPIDKNSDVTLHFTVPPKKNGKVCSGIHVHLDDGSYALVMPVVL